MKKILHMMLVFLMLVGATITVQAATGSVSISGPSSIQIGNTAQYTIAFSASEEATFEFTVSSSNPGVLSITSDSFFIQTSAGSVTVTVMANAAGSATISVAGYGIELTNFSEFTLSGSQSVTVSAPSTGGSSGGGSSSGGSSSGGGVDTTEAEKEAARQAEEEARRNRPLVASISIVSQSDKQNGGTLVEIPAVESIFDYDYVLPKNIAAFQLNLTAIADNVQLSYESEHRFADDEMTKEIIITAVQDDLEQTFVVRVSRSEVASTTLDVAGIDYTIWDDDAVDAWFAELGFERIDYTDDQGNGSFAYVMNALRVQLMVDEDLNAVWVQLDENNQFVRKTILVINDSNELLLLREAPEADQGLTHKGEAYEDQPVVVDERITALNSAFVFETSTKGWSADSGAIVYGLQTDGTEGYHFIDGTGFESAFVSFDIVDQFYQYWAYSATAFAVAVSAALAAYWLVERKRSKAVTSGS